MKRNLPNRGGDVSDEDTNKVSGEADDKLTGQDHSIRTITKIKCRKTAWARFKTVR